MEDLLAKDLDCKCKHDQRFKLQSRIVNGTKTYAYIIRRTESTEYAVEHLLLSRDCSSTSTTEKKIKHDFLYTQITTRQEPLITIVRITLTQELSGDCFK